MKKAYVLLIIVVTLLTFACSKQEAKTAAAPASRILKLAATLQPDASPIKCLEEAAATIKSTSNGTLELQIFPASQLGGQREFTEGVSMGTVDMCLIANGALESFDPRWAIYSVPFLFNNADHVYDYYNSDLSKTMLDEFRTQKGIRTMGMFTEGEFRTVWTRTKPVRSLADFRGVKLRVPEVPIYIDIFTALGANATPMPIGDVYTGLQTGIVDGLELAATSVILSNLHEVNKYNTKTMHICSPMVVLMNEQIFQSLTPDQQKIVSDAIAAASAKDRINAAENAKNNDSVLVANGLELIELPAEEKEKIQVAIQPIVEQYTQNTFPGDYLNQVRMMGK
jgi:tripartite ATP-independent transporter DctP family solute receptor